MSLILKHASLSFGASVDQQTGMLSVFEIVEELRVPQLPMTLSSLVISLSLEKTIADAHRGRLFIHVLTPDQRSQSLGNGDLSVPAEQKRVKAVFRFGGFPVMQFGQHRFVISWTDGSGEKIGEALLDFDVIQATQVAQGVAPAEKPPVTH